VSRHQTVADRELRLCRSSVPSQYWVRLAETGRTLGCVYKIRSQWRWATTRTAFRGDGRPGSATDGIGDVVPEHLDAEGTAATQIAACAALVAHLEVRKAPALGYGPHPDVRSPSHV
jgi:hypothetical protein